jgi:hypothetical protein
LWRTLLVESQPQRPLLESIAQAAVPFAVSPARRLLAGKDSVYDTAST